MRIPALPSPTVELAREVELSRAALDRALAPGSNVGPRAAQALHDEYRAACLAAGVIPPCPLADRPTSTPQTPGRPVTGPTPEEGSQ